MIDNMITQVHNFDKGIFVFKLYQIKTRDADCTAGRVSTGDYLAFLQHFLHRPFS